MKQFYLSKSKSIVSILALVMLGFYVNGQVYVEAPVFNWNFEAENILLDEGTAQQNLTNNGSVTTGGQEPAFPGYGSVGAVFTGDTTILSLTNADYGDRALNGTDRDGTIYVCLSPVVEDQTETVYLFSFYNSGETQRQLALVLKDNGKFDLIWGYDGGASFDIEAGNPAGFPAVETGENIILALSLDAAAKTYTYMARYLSSGSYYSTTELNHPLPGEYYTGTADLTIGGRSDYNPARSFEGKIYWLRVYDEAQTYEQMQAVIEGLAVVTGIADNKVVRAELQNYPNPFRGETTISYNVSKSAFISINIYNMVGQKITTLVNENKEAGPHTVRWDGQNSLGKALPSGMYYYTLKAGGGKIQSRKMLLMK